MTPKQIGAAVRKARGERSVRQVALASGIKRDQVKAIEDGKGYTMSTFLALCRVIGLTLRMEQGSEG